MTHAMQAAALALLCLVPRSLADAPSIPVVVQRVQVARGQGGLTGSTTPDPLDRFGAALAPVGDLDGDGVLELAVGAPFQDDGFPAGGGGVWILFLQQDGLVRAHQEISEIRGGLGNVLDTLDMFGDALAALGDLNGDGVEDLAVGAPGDDDGGADAGALWILFLGADGTVQDRQKVSNLTGGFSGGLAAAERFGSALAFLGDLDGDGFGELAVGAPGRDAGGLDAGAVWILSLHGDGTVRSERRLDATAGVLVGAVDAGDALGEGLASLGDLDGDGTHELAVGAVGDELSGQGFGSVLVLSLASDGTAVGLQPITAGVGGMLGDGFALGAFGAGLACAGDVDGDGVLDLAVGDSLNREGALGASSKGALWILLLNPDATVREQQKFGALQGNLGAPPADNSLFGLAIASLGDLDGDGHGDLAAGAPQDPSGGTLAGAVHGLFLNHLASATARNAGANPASLSASAPVLGSAWSATVDLATSGHAFAQLLGYETPLQAGLAGGQTLLINVADPAGELLGFGLVGGPLAVFGAAVPPDPSMAGRCLSVQAIHALGAVPFALSNAVDLVVGF